MSRASIVNDGGEKYTQTCIRNLKWRHFILIIVQRDGTQSSLFIILQVHSKCFGCQPHPSSGVNKTVTTAYDTGHIFCAAPTWQQLLAAAATLEGGSFV